MDFRKVMSSVSLSDRGQIDDLRAQRRLPNLFVIGAMKSGTNYLRKLLGRHRAIFTAVGEPSYFVDPDELKVVWPQMWARGYWRDERNYLQLFASGDGLRPSLTATARVARRTSDRDEETALFNRTKKHQSL